MKILSLFGLITSLLFIQSCTIIKPGEIGIDVKLGKVKDKVLEPGAHHFAPKVFRYVVRYETRTINHNTSFLTWRKFLKKEFLIFLRIEFPVPCSFQLRPHPILE